jgi:hypothetical protein
MLRQFGYPSVLLSWSPVVLNRISASIWFAVHVDMEQCKQY